MSDLYSRMSAKVLEMMDRFGVAMTLTQQTSATFNPATGSETASASSSTTVKGIVQSPQLTKVSTSTVGEFFFNGTKVLADDKFLLVAAEGLASSPNPGDKLTMGGVVHNIMSVIAVSPAGIDLAYRILARK